MRHPVSNEDTDTGFIIENVAIQSGKSWKDADYLISDTRMQSGCPKHFPETDKA